jgi:chemotaxis signal transduction protein
MQEIVWMVEITKITKTPEYVERIINLRGRIVPYLISESVAIFAERRNRTKTGFECFMIKYP